MLNASTVLGCFWQEEKQVSTSDNWSKKFKKQTQETSCSKSYVKLDSSFMNLISNMIKGCSQSTQDEDKSLALNLENPNHHLQQPDQKLLKCNKNKYLELKNAGFRSNF